MAKVAFREIAFRTDSRVRIARILQILEDYPDQQLTARQVYYQFVARGWLDNNVKNYKNLTNLLTDARYAGLVDWDAVEDRGRVAEKASEWSNIGALVDSAVYAYRLPRWAGQSSYVELWVEKQALAGVLSPIAHRNHVTLMVNKGYSSASAMKDAAGRMIRARKNANSVKTVHLFYLGDHDPSGEDMVRDVRDRLIEFGVTGLKVTKLGLTWAQIQDFNPPPNPAKLTDSRAKAYIEKFGEESWELDALPPRELNRIVEAAISHVIDREMMDVIIAKEERDKERLRVAAENIMEGDDDDA